MASTPSHRHEHVFGNDCTHISATAPFPGLLFPPFSPVGPRQAGKTTLARQIVSPDSAAYFHLEGPTSLARLAEPMTALAPLRGVVVIDEIQRRPGLFPILRVLTVNGAVTDTFVTALAPISSGTEGISSAEEWPATARILAWVITD